MDILISWGLYCIMTQHTDNIVNGNILLTKLNKNTLHELFNSTV